MSGFFLFHFLSLSFSHLFSCSPVFHLSLIPRVFKPELLSCSLSVHPSSRQCVFHSCSVSLCLSCSSRSHCSCGLYTFRFCKLFDFLILWFSCFLCFLDVYILFLNFDYWIIYYFSLDFQLYVNKMPACVFCIWMPMTRSDNRFMRPKFNWDQDNKSVSRSNFTVEKTNLSRLCGGRHKVNANVYNMLISADKSRSVISPCCSNSESIAFAVCTGPCTFCSITELNQCKANHFSPTAANTTVFWHVGTQTHEKKHFVNSKNTDEPCVYMQVPQQNNSVCH